MALPDAPQLLSVTKTGAQQTRWRFNAAVTSIPDPDGFFVTHTPSPGVTGATIQADPRDVLVDYDGPISVGDPYDLSPTTATYAPGQTFPHATGVLV